VPVYNIILVCASIVLLCFYSVETALVCVCVMRVESAAAALASGEKMDGWMCSAVRIKRSPLSPPPVYVADNQTGFVSSTALVSVRVCVCVCCCCRVVVFSCVCIVRLYNIIVVVVALSPLTRTLSPSVTIFFSAPANPCTTTMSLVVFTACILILYFLTS